MTPPATRIALVTPSGTDGPGGICRVAKYVTANWRDPNVAIHLFDSYGPGSRRTMPFHFLRALSCFAVHLLARRIDVVHINLSERLSIPRKGAFIILARLFGRPVVMHMHGADFAEYFAALPGWRRHAVKRLFAACDRVICLGSYWHDYAVAKLALPSGRAVVLRNAVPGADRPLRRDPACCRLLFLGALGERKGLPTLIRALADPRLAQGRWQAVIAGNGDVDLYRRMAADCGLAGRVAFTGWIDENGARDQLAASDILILPSRNEGLPMAILEAMSFGCAVIATPVGSIADAVIDGETGLLVPVDDPDALAAALARLIADAGLRRTLGDRARQRFAEAFEINAYNRRLADLWRDVAGRATD